jgi:hypothetical protein
MLYEFNNRGSYFMKNLSKILVASAASFLMLGSVSATMAPVVHSLVDTNAKIAQIKTSLDLLSKDLDHYSKESREGKNQHHGERVRAGGGDKKGKAKGLVVSVAKLCNTLDAIKGAVKDARAYATSDDAVIALANSLEARAQVVGQELLQASISSHGQEIQKDVVK